MNDETLQKQLPLQNGLPLNEPLLGYKPGENYNPINDPHGVFVTDMTLWDAFHIQQANSDLIELIARPKKTTFKVDEVVSLSIDLKYESFVFLLGKDDKGAIQLIFPNSTDIGQCLKKADSRLEEMNELSMPAGVETFKIVTIRRDAPKADELAQRLLNAFFKASNGKDVTDTSGAKAVTIKWVGDFRIATSQFTLKRWRDEGAKEAAKP